MSQPRAHYTPDEQLGCVLSDLRNDIVQAERQATEGPYFETITPASLRAYAEVCRQKIAQIEACKGRALDTVNEFIAGRI